MARNVDERIVEMQFDNKQFESGVKESINSLDKLKNSLELDGAAKGFEKLDAAAGKLNFNPIQNGVEAITQKFSALEIIGITALQRITNQVMATGERLLKSFTIDPITAGWSKYEQKVESVQKILNSSADNTMPKVEAALEKIGWYTDETSYQFDAMVSTLGSFSAAGIKLEDATNTIIGLANAAAISGVNAQNASHGFLGFQRAIGSGYLSLGIWNSYLKTAGFQSQKFIQGCMDAAVQVGTLTKELDGAYHTAKGTAVTLATFGETLQEKWVSKDVITKMAQNFSVASDQLYAVKDNYDMIRDAVDDLGEELDQYSLQAFLAGQETKTWGDAVEYVKGTVAQGWSKTWEKVFGNYEEAKDFYSELVEKLYELFVVSGNARNEVLEMWRALGGSAVFRKALLHLADIVINVVNTVRGAFTQLFPIFDDQEGMAKLLNKLSLRFEHVTKIALTAFEKIKIATEPAQKAISRISQGVRDANEAGQQTAKVLESISEMARRVIRGEFGNGQERINQLRELGYCYEEVQNQVNELLGNSFRYTDFKKADTLATNEQVEANGKLTESAKHVATQIERVYTTFDNLVSTFRGVIAVYQIVVNLFQAVVRVSSELINPLLKIGDGILGITGSLGDAIVELKDFLIETDFFYNNLKKVADFISTTFAPVFERIGKLLDQFKNRNFKSVVDWVTQLANSIKSMFSRDVEKSITNFGVGFKGINASIRPVVNLTGALINVNEKAANSSNTFANVISILTSALDIFWSILKVVGKAVSSFAGTALDKAAEALGTVAVFLKDLAKKDITSKITKFTKNIKEFFTTFLASATGLQKVKAAFDYFKKNKGMFSAVFESLFDKEFTAGNLAQVVKVKLQDFADIFGLDAFGIIEPIRGFFDTIAKIIGAGVDSIKTVFEKIDFRKIFATVGFGALVFFVVQIGKLAGAIPAFLQSISGIAKGFTNLMEGLNGLFDGFKKKMKMNAISGLITSIAILVLSLTAALYILTQKVDVNNLTAVAFTLGALIGLIIWLVSELTKLSVGASAKQIAMVSVSMVAIGIMFLAIASAMNILIGMDLDSFMVGIFRMAAIAAALYGLMYLMQSKKIGQKDAFDPKSMVAFLLFVASIKSAVKTILELSEADTGKTWKAIGMFGAIALELAFLAKGLNGLAFSGSAGFAVVLLSINLFIKMIKNLADEDFGKLYATLIKLTPMFVMILGIVGVISVIGSKGYAAAALIAALGFLIEAIAGALKKIASIESGKLSGAVTALTILTAAVMAVVGFVTWLSNQKIGKAGQNRLNQYSAMFVAIGIALFAIASALRMLAGLGFQDLLWPAVALGGVITAVCFALNLVEKSNLKMGPVVALSVLIGTLSLALLVLSYLMDDIPKAMLAATYLVLVIAAVGFVINAMNGLDYKTAIVTAGSMVVLIATIVGALWFLTTLDSEKVLTAVLALGVIMGETAIVIAVMSKINIAAAWTAVKSLALVIGGIAVIIGALAGLLSLADETKLEKGLDNLVLIFTKFGEMIGGFFSGTLEGLTSRLPQVGENLSSFSDNVQKFIDTFTNKTVDWKTLAESTINIANAINSLKRINVSEEEAKTMRQGMGYLATGINRFYNRINDANVDIPTAKKAAEIVDILVGVLVYNPDINAEYWERLGTGLASLGSSLVSFSNVVSGNKVDEGSVNKAIRIIRRLGETAKEIGDLSDFHGWGALLSLDDEVGTMDPKTGLSGLQNLALALVNFNNAVSPSMQGEGGLNSEYMEIALKSLKTLVECAKQVPNAGGILQEWLGGFQGWDSISDGLTTLAVRIVRFAAIAGGVDQEAFDNGIESVSKLNDLAHTLDKPFEGGLVQDIIGDNTLGGLATALLNLVPQLKEFASFTRGMDPKQVDQAFTILNKIIKVARDFEVTESFLSIGDQLVNFAYDFQTAYNVLSGITDESDTISSLFTSFVSLFSPDVLEQLTTIGTSMSNAVANGFSKDSTIISTAVSTVIEYYEASFTDRHTRYVEAGKELARQLSNGFSSSEAKANVDSSVDDISSTMVARTRTWYGNNWSGMYGAGSYLVQGLIDGFNSKAQEAINAASSLAGAINGTFTGIQKEHSPSQVWFGFGSFLVQGLINGIEENTPTVVNQVQKLANAMNGAFDNAIDLEAQAEGITPVFQSTLDSLDTSSMARRASRIGTSRDYSAVAAASSKSFTIQNLSVYGTENMDVNELSDAVIDKLNRQLASENSRWAY